MPLIALRRAVESNASVAERLYDAYLAKDEQALRELIHELDLVCADLVVVLEELESLPPLLQSDDDLDEEDGKPTTPKR